MSVQALLDHAAKAKSANDAMDRLVAAWNENPAPALEAALVALDQHPPFDGDQAAFLKAARSAKPSQRGPLLAAATTGTLAEVTRRLELLHAWPADPRTSRRLLELFSSVPWSSDSSKPAWTAAFALMVKQRDARFVAAAKTLPATWKVRATMKQWLDRAFTRALQQLSPRKPAQLTAKEQATLEKVLKVHAAPPKAKAATGKDEASLLAAVYAAPVDDAPRAVLADLLQEKNDPRGEFIALQLANDPKASKLVKAHGKTWLGALGPVLTADVEFRRGFPAVGRTKFRHQADAEKFGALPAWATFEELEWPSTMTRGQEPFCGFIGPAFRHLKVARGPHLPSLLAAKAPWALESLEVRVSDSAELSALGAALPVLFPKLTHLTVVNMRGEWFRDVKHLDRLTELTVRGSAHGYTEGWAVLRSLPVKALTLSTGASRWSFARGTGGAFSKLTLHLADAENALRHEDLARLLPTGFLESFEVVPGQKPDKKAVEAIGRALEAAQKRWKGAGASTKSGPVVTPLRSLGRTFLIRDLPGGERVAVDVDGVQVLAKGTTDVIHLHGVGISGAAMNADGTRLALASSGVTVLSLPTLERVWASKSKVEDVRGLQFQGSSLWLFARTGSERFNAQTGAPEEQLGPVTRLYGLSSDGAFALRSAKTGGFEVGPLGARTATPVPGQHAAFVADDQVLSVDAPNDGTLTLHLVDPRTQAATRATPTFTVKGGVFQLAISPQGRSALIAVNPGFVVVDLPSLEARLIKKVLRAFAAFASEGECVAEENRRFVRLVR
jgi:uncharacterized protein (TIGR02996 family)